MADAPAKFDYSALKEKSGPLGQETETKIKEDAMRELAEEDAARIAAEGGEHTPAAEEKENKPAEKPVIETDKIQTPEEKAAEEKAAQDQKNADEAKAKDEAAKEAAQKVADEAKTDAIILGKKDEELTEPEKARKTEVLKAESEDLSKRVKLYADAERITEDEATKVISSEKAIAEKYGLDYKTPAGEKAARTIRSAQQMVSEKDTQIKNLSDQVELIKIQDKIIINNKAMTFEEARPAMVEYYREAHPEMAEKTDEEVFTAAKTEYQNALKTRIDKKKQELNSDAKSRRAKLILDLPLTAKPYQADIENILNTTPDINIVHPSFSVSDVILWAKGKNFDDAVKKAREEGVKIGQENRKILGTKSGDGQESKPSGSAPAQKTATGTAKRQLNKIEQAEALRKYDGVSISDEKKFEYWAEILWEEEEEIRSKSKNKK